MLSYITDQQNFRIVMYGFALIAFWPIFWDIFYTPFFGKRAKAVKYGASLIYRHQDTLSFTEIAEKWVQPENSQGYTNERIVEWLISDLWIGAFENIKGETELYLDISTRNVQKHLPASRLNLINACFAFLTQEQQKRCNQKNVSLPIDYSLPESERRIQLAHIDWKYLSSLAVTDFKESKATKMYAKENESSFRAYIKSIIVPKKSFVSWLIKHKHPLPEKWDAKI